MTAALTPFDNGEFAIVATDHPADGFRVQAPGLARALGFAEARDLLRSIPDEEKGSELSPTPGGEQRIGYVTEAGFYRAMGQRQAARVTDPGVRAQVERFQSWVYREVLPALRRGPVDPATVTRGDLARMVIAAEEELAVVSAALTAAAPAIAYHERYVLDDDVLLVKVWGAQFGLTGPQAYQLLLDRNVIYRRFLGDRWSASRQRREPVHEYLPRAGRQSFAWFDVRPQPNAPRHHNGQVRQTLYVRQGYALDLAKLLGLAGQPAIGGAA